MMNDKTLNTKIPTVSLYGLSISKLSMKETVAFLEKAIVSRQPHQVITINPIMIMAALDSPSHMDAMKRAELLVPDGSGVVWAAKHIGEPVTEKVAGIELMQELFKLGEQKGWRVFLLGASSEIIQAAADKVRNQFPRLNLVGVQDGYFTDSQDDEIIHKIHQVSPDLLFVGRSADKQETWIDRYKMLLNVPIVMGVGGSFDVISGKLKRAPKWMISLHLEWLHRLKQEPWRFKRMLLLPKFVVRVVCDKEKLRNAG